MTFVQLEYIIALDTYRNFVVAAEKCFVTQPTLSMQIQKLELELGVKLFDRSRHPVVPTETGKEIIEQARKILAEGSKISELISVHKGEVRGELKVGVIPTIAPYLLPKIIVNFVKKYPKVQLQIWEYTTDQIIAQLKTGLLDCGILSTPIGDPGLKEIVLFYEPFVAYASESSPILKKDLLVSEDIESDELWILNEGHCMRNQVLNLCQKKSNGNNSRHFEYNTGSVETLKRMVDVNEGITILPQLSISDFTDTQLKRVRYFTSPEPVREISIITHRNFLKRSAITALEKEILEVVPKEMYDDQKKDVMEIYV